jgi:hypothetical protein
MPIDDNLLNLYDHEVAEIQRVHRLLQGRTAVRRDLQGFDDEIVERFAEIGFKVSVKWYETNQEGAFIPEVEIVGKCAPLAAGSFDHDRQRHEVVNNLLKLPEADAGIIPAGTYTRPQPHKH